MPFCRGWVYVVSSQQSELTIKPHRHEDLNSDLQHPHKSQTLQNPFVTPGLVCGSDNQTYPCKIQFLYPLASPHIPSIPVSELKKKHHCNCVELCVILFWGFLLSSHRVCVGFLWWVAVTIYTLRDTICLQNLNHEGQFCPHCYLLSYRLVTFLFLDGITFLNYFISNSGRCLFILSCNLQSDMPFVWCLLVHSSFLATPVRTGYPRDVNKVWEKGLSAIFSNFGARVKGRHQH